MYGTAACSGTYDNGTVFQLNRVNSTWVFSPLYGLPGETMEASQSAGVVFGRNGALYGTTQLGGAAGDGVVYALRPPSTFCRSTSCPWNETILHLYRGPGWDKPVDRELSP